MGEKKVDPQIKISVSGEDFEKGTGEKKTYYRKRRIPKTKVKNYPVKPIQETQLTKKQGTEEKYDEVSSTMQFTTSDRDPGETMNTHVVFDREIFKNGYGLYNQEEGEKICEQYRELIGLTRGFHVINPKHNSPRNKISLWCQIPENSEDIKEEVISTVSSPSSIRTNYSSTWDMISKL